MRVADGLLCIGGAMGFANRVWEGLVDCRKDCDGCWAFGLYGGGMRGMASRRLRSMGSIDFDDVRLGSVGILSIRYRSTGSMNADDE